MPFAPPIRRTQTRAFSVVTESCASARLGGPARGRPSSALKNPSWHGQASCLVAASKSTGHDR